MSQVPALFPDAYHRPEQPHLHADAASFHPNPDLDQLFDAPRASLLTIQEFFQSKSRPVLARQLVSANQFLEILSTRFGHGSRVMPDESRHLVLLFLRELYESIRHYIVLECDSEPVVTGVVSAPHTLSPGQVSISLDKEVQKLRLSDDMIERIEQFVNTLHREVTRKTRNTSPKERVVETVKFWIDQIDALSRYAFPELGDDVVESVNHALKGIREVLDMRELGSVSSLYFFLTVRTSAPPHGDQGFHTRNRDLYFWQNLKAGGDGIGNVYKVKSLAIRLTADSSKGHKRKKRILCMQSDSIYPRRSRHRTRNDVGHFKWTTPEYHRCN
jgi:hypothetical protein